MNLIEFIRSTRLEALDLPATIAEKLTLQKIDDFQKLYTSVKAYKTFHSLLIEGLSDEEMKFLELKINQLLVKNGLLKAQPAPAQSTAVRPSTVVTPARSAPPQRTSVQPAAPKRVQPERTPASTGNGPVESPESPLPRPPLIAWEENLSRLLRRVELIGEIPLTEKDLDNISLNIKKIIPSRSDAALSMFERTFPVTFLVFMVGQGIYNYRGGDFWSSTEALKYMSRIDAGRLFEKLLIRYRKPQFLELQERSFRYVSPILAHGGIPVYCLNDFFANIVLNSVTRPQLAALEGEELVEEILKHSTYTLNTDKPVIHFLEFGGRTAANLLDRARKMLIDWQINQALPSPDEIGLPGHLVEYFGKWARENNIGKSDPGSRTRYKRPVLSLDPWGLGVFLELPAQPVSANNMDGLYWTVQAKGVDEKIKARTQRKGDKIETREITLRLSEVPEKITVQFGWGDNDYERQIEGFSRDNYLLAFDPVTGHHLNNIFARETWIVCRKRISIIVDGGTGNLTEVLPDLPGEWSNFKLEAWDLSNATRLKLTDGRDVFGEISVRSQEKIEKPSLEGGSLVPADYQENPVPVYSGTLPELVIPINATDDLSYELGRWSLRIANVDGANPEIAFRSSLSALPTNTYNMVGNTVRINLHAPQLLQKRPAGTYQIDVKGPLGRDITLTLKVLPEFRVLNLKERYIPDHHAGPEDVVFDIQTSFLETISTLSNTDGIKVETIDSGLHRISVPSGVSSVGLLVRRQAVNRQHIQMTIPLRVNRLRWRIVAKSGVVDNWQHKYITLSGQTLLQEEAPVLIVDFPGNQENQVGLSIKVMDIYGNLVQEIPPADRSRSRATRFWRFDLSKIYHTINTSDSPTLRLDLVGISDRQEDSFTLPALVLTREVQIMQISSEVYSSANQHHILMSWKEKKPLHSRAFVLWSLFRPWQPPIVVPVPDSADGEHEFSLDKSDCAEGVYRTQMVVVDPWAPTPPAPVPPPANEVSCHDIELVSPQARLQTLRGELAVAAHQQKPVFSKRMELFLVRRHLGDIEGGYTDLDACCRDLQPATAREIIALANILYEINNPNFEKEFGEQLIKPEVMSRLADSVITGEVAYDEFMDALRMLPQPKSWPAKTCEILSKLEDPQIRFSALHELADKDAEKLIERVIQLSQQSNISLQDAVELLYTRRQIALKRLRAMEDDAVTSQLAELLSRYDPYSGIPVVRIGSWVNTNVGWGKIEDIRDPHSHITIDSFLEGSADYLLLVNLHIYESPDLSGEKATIDMEKNEITFPRVNRIYLCPYCEEFTTGRFDLIKSHMIINHGNAVIPPGQKLNSVSLTFIQFNLQPQNSR